MNETTNETYKEEFEQLKALIREYGGVDSYNTDQAVKLFALIYQMIKEQGFDPRDRGEFFEGLRRVLDIQYTNLESLSSGKYILVPNHVSEFDGLIFGILIPNMMVVAKTAWISNPNLNAFVSGLFQVVGLVRHDTSSGMNVLRNCMDHLNAVENGAVTIFVQQTIADIDRTTPEDVANGALLIAKKTGAKIVPVYAEQVSPDHPMRVVIGEPMTVANKNDFGKEWLEQEYALRDSLIDPPARPPILCEKHLLPISERDF